jgi:DNA polymerase (family X)
MSDNYRISNKEVIKILKEVLAAMEVKEYNKFRVRAYQNALGVIESLTTSVYDLWKAGRLDEIPGVGSSLADHLNELFSTGDVKEFKVIKKDLPEGMFSLIGIRSVGAKRAYRLSKEFKLTDRDTAVEKLKEAAVSGLVREMEGFGEKSEAEIINAIEEAKLHKREKPRLLLVHAEEIADRVLKYIRAFPFVIEAEALGSLRRRSSTVGDLDIAVSSDDPEAVIKSFIKYSEIAEVTGQGDKKVGSVLTNGTQVDLRVSKPECFGSMVQYFTGNKQHNVQLRTYALENGLSLSEYGIKSNGTIEEFSNEKDFYQRLNLPHIPPELRQGSNEIDLAIKGKLPRLIELSDIKGDLHTHTVASDGLNTLAEMVAAAREKGYRYIGIADHSPSIQSRGYSEVEGIIHRQRKNIDNMNDSQEDITVLFGYEVNILADATLSLPDEFLQQLDYVIAGVHTAFNQSRQELTDRLVAAINNPYVSVIAHPSGRLINERDPLDLDWEVVFTECVKNNKILEINSQPNRLDLEEDLVKEAHRRGIQIIIDTDAHDSYSLNFMKYGIDVARRSFLTRNDVINTKDVDVLKGFLKR